MTDHYEALGVDRDADAATIKRAYRKLAAETHPDKPDGDEETFKAVNAANIVLSDPDRRAQYDRTGDDGQTGDQRQAVVIASLVQAFQQAIAAALSSMSGLEMTNIIGATKRNLLDQIGRGRTGERPA